MTTTEPLTSAALRSQLAEAGDKMRQLRETAPDARGETFASDVAETALTIRSLDAEFTAARAREAEEVISPAGAEAALSALGLDEGRSVGSQYAQSQPYQEWRQHADYRTFPEVETRALITSSESDTSAAGVLRPVGDPIPPIPRQRRFFVRDLLSTGTTTLAAIPYVRELTPATNETGATAVPEGSAKPEATMQFVQVTAETRKIAAWVPATMEILEDAPTLASYINARLVYMVRVREEADLISGSPSGLNPTVEGITVVAGTQTQSALQSNSVNDYTKTLGTAIGKVENVDGEANGIAMNPVDFWSMMTTRWGTDGGNFDSGSPFFGPPGTVWGLPVVRTRAMATSQAIVADWRAGGQVFDRSGIVVKTADQHDTYFIYNKVAILAEKRLAFAIYRPDLFVIVDLTV